MRNISMQRPRYFINSIAKGLAVLEAFSEAGPLTLSKIAGALKSNNTTATRLCYTLAELGFIQKDEQKRYHLTPKILTLGHAYISGLAWYEVAQYYLERLFREVQETVSLSILEGSEIIYVLRIRKRKYLPFDIQVGTKLPVYCTAMGKVLMAMGPPQKIQSILKGLEFKSLTARTITRSDKFLEELDRVRKKGYAINDEELSIGNRSVAAPILDEKGYAVAAIHIAVPTTEYSRSQMEKTLAPQVIKTAREISDALIKMEAPIVTRGLLEPGGKNRKSKLGNAYMRSLQNISAKMRLPDTNVRPIGFK
jgi:IclR family pca regulon transcriptional regulator